MYFSIGASDSLFQSLLRLFHPSIFCPHRVSLFSSRERRRSREAGLGFFGESAKQMRLLVSVERYLQFGNCYIDGRLKYWVQRVNGERERGWVLNRRSTYRGSKTANGKGSKLEKKVAVRLYLFFFRRDRVEFLLSA